MQERDVFDSNVLPDCNDILLKDGVTSVRQVRSRPVCNKYDSLILPCQAGGKMLADLHLVFGDDFSTRFCAACAIYELGSQSDHNTKLCAQRFGATSQENGGDWQLPPPNQW